MNKFEIKTISFKKNRCLLLVGLMGFMAMAMGCPRDRKKVEACEGSDVNSCLNKSQCKYFYDKDFGNNLKGLCLERSEPTVTCTEIAEEARCGLLDYASDGECKWENDACKPKGQAPSGPRTSGPRRNNGPHQIQGPLQLNNPPQVQVPLQFNNPPQVQAPLQFNNPPQVQVPLFNNPPIVQAPLQQNVPAWQANVQWHPVANHMGFMINKDKHGFARDGRHRLEVALGAGAVLNAEEFVRQARLYNEPVNEYNFWDNEKTVLKEEVAKRILDMNLVQTFNNLNPTFDQTYRFLRQNGGIEGDKALQLITLIKTGVDLSALTGSEYAQLMGQVFANAYNNAAYLRANSAAILLTASDFIGLNAHNQEHRFARSYKDLNKIREFLAAVPLRDVPELALDDVELRRLELVNNLDQHILDKKAYKSGQKLPRLKAAVLAKFQQANPDVNARLGYYFLRDPQTWGEQHIKHVHNKDYVCAVNLEERAEHGGEGFEFPGGATYCKDCLKEYISLEFDQDKLPIMSPALDDLNHELPITEALLREALGNDDAKIEKWKKLMFKEYAGALGMDSIVCGHPQCENVVFDSEKDANGHVICAACETHFCFDCQKGNIMRSHVGQNCGDLAQEVYFGPEVVDDRPCPYCRKWLNMIGGCNWFECSTTVLVPVPGRPGQFQRIPAGGCGAKFHWVYGKFRNGMTGVQRHWAGADGFNNAVVPARLYRVPGDLDYAPGKECAFPDNGQFGHGVMTQTDARTNLAD